MTDVAPPPLCPPAFSNGHPAANGTEAAPEQALFEKRVVYRRGLTSGPAKPPPGTIVLTSLHGNVPDGQPRGKGQPGSKPLANGSVLPSDPTRPPRGTELCDEREIDKLMEWEGVKGVDTGLLNTSVTCYMNACLQCLMHTPPLANYLAKKYGVAPLAAPAQGPGLKVGKQGIDWSRKLSEITRWGLVQAPKARHVVNPVFFGANLKRLSPSLRRGRLEDAQEFCNHLLDALHEEELKRYPDEKDPLAQATTPTHTIFGGFYQSRVSWSKQDELTALREKKTGQHHLTPDDPPKRSRSLPSRQAPEISPEIVSAPAFSSKYDPFTVLTVEIAGSTVDACLANFTKPEVLSGDNKYETPSGVKVSAKKAFTVYRAPRILVLHLKRFISNMWGDTKKNPKHVEFPLALDLSRFTSSSSSSSSSPAAKRSRNPNNGSQKAGAVSVVGDSAEQYELYAVVVHLGRGTQSGHYIAFVKPSNGLWYCCDDEAIRQVSVDLVLQQQAYLLFYKRISPPCGGPPSDDGEAPPQEEQPAKKKKGLSQRQKRFEEARAALVAKRRQQLQQQLPAAN
eukprot:gene118-178_t